MFRTIVVVLGVMALLAQAAFGQDAPRPAGELESSAWWLNRAVDYAKQIEDAEARSEANNKLVYALAGEGDFTRALQSASEVTKPQIRVYAFSRIAKLAHEKGDTATCDEALRKARELAIPAQFVSHGMIRLYFELDRSDEAVTFAAAVPDRVQKRYAYQIVADEMAKQGRIDEALAIINRHEPADSQDSGRASIAIACARASRFDQAIELAEKVKKTASRDAAYDQIAEELIRARSMEQGEAIALRIENERKRANRLAHHLAMSVKSKDAAKATDAAMAEAATREEKISIGMLKFAELVEQREVEKAEALIVALVKIIEDSPREPQASKFGTFDDSLQVATVKAGYLETAKLLKEAGDEAGVKDRIAKSVAAVKAIKSSSIGKEQLVARLIRGQAELGDFDGAQANSSLLDTDFMRSTSHGDLAASLILSGKVDKGVELALEVDPQHYAYCTRRVATALISVERFDKLADYLPLIPDTGNDVRAFREIARELVKSGNVKRLDLLLSSLTSDAARTHACLGAFDQLRAEQDTAPLEYQSQEHCVNGFRLPLLPFTVHFASNDTDPGTACVSEWEAIG